MSTKYRENSVKEKKRKDDEEGGIIIREVGGGCVTRHLHLHQEQERVRKRQNPLSITGNGEHGEEMEIVYPTGYNERL